MKRKLPLLALLIMLSFVLTACTIQDLPVIGKLFAPKDPGNNVPSTPVTLNMWGLWENPDVMHKMIAKYQESHPNVTINYDDRSIMKPDDYRDRVFNSVQGATDADIIVVHNSWVSRLKDSLAPMPSTLMDANTYASTFYPVAADSAVVDGKVYAVPFYYDGLALVYNKKHFRDIGQTEPPTAWEEFRRLALQLTVKGPSGLVRGGAAIGTSTNVDFFSDILGLMWSQAGVAIPNELDSKPAQDALSFYTNFAKEDQVWNSTMPEAATAFANEQVSMMFAPAWLVSDIVAARPNLEIGVAPVPQARPSSPVTWASFWMEAVPASSKNAATAWDFLNYMSQEEQQLQFFNENTAVRKLASPYSLVSLSGQLSADPYLGAYVNTAPYAKSGIMVSRAGNKTQIELLKTAVTSVLGGETPEAALKKMLGK